MRPCRVIAAAAVLAATGLLSGCWPLPSDPAVLEHAGAKLLVAGSLDGGMDAAMGGTVAVLPGGCVGVDTEGGSAVLAWPPGTGFADGEPLGIRLPDGLVLRVGDRFSSGGGILRDSAEVPDVPAGCPPGNDGLFVLNDVRKG